MVISNIEYGWNYIFWWGRFKPFKRNLPEIAESSWAKFRGNLSNTVNLWDIGVNE